MIYLDNSSTTYPKPESVYKALDRANREFAFNAGRGTYSKAKEAFDITTECRSILGAYVGKSTNDVIFTASATEALNLLIRGMSKTIRNVYVSVFEHNAVIRTIKAHDNIQLNLIPFDKNTWKLNESELKEMFKVNKPDLVIISHVSNVTGYILPFDKIFELSKKYQSINILDAAQSFGIIKPDTENVDFIVFAGHKSLYGPFGVGGFININVIDLEITKHGGTGSDSLNLNMPSMLPNKFEAGSLNVVAIAGLLESIKWVIEKNPYENIIELTSYLYNELNKIDGLNILLKPEIASLGIISFTYKDFDSDDISLILDEEFNIAVRGGYHCAPLVHNFIGSLKNKGCVRVSIGCFNTKNDIDQLTQAIKMIGEN